MSRPSLVRPARLVAALCLGLGLTGALVATTPVAAAAAVGDEVIAFVEVEDGTITGGAAGPPVLNSGDHGNVSGTGSYTFRETGMTSTMSVTAPAAGTYPVWIRYAAGPLGADENVTRSMGLLTNGGARQVVSYPMTSTENWEAWRFARADVTLAAGANTIAVQCDRGTDFCRLNFDAIQVGGTAPDPCVATPALPGATQLFDGTFASFDGWRKAGAGGFGRQTDCSIMSLRGRGATWFTTQQTSPYTLRLDWKRMDANDDSSVYLGSSSRGGADPVGGLAVAIGEGTGTITPAGGTAQAPDAAAVTAALRPVGQWNTYTLALTPAGLKLSLNGTVVNTFTAPAPLAALGHVGLENRGFLDTVRFRDIQLTPGVEPEPPTTQDVQVLATGDLQGHLDALPTLAGAVKELRAEAPDTVLAATGDLVGGSPFASYVAEDAPTIDALDEAGLDVSALGHHELDRGLADLTGRIAERADWDYLAANLRRRTDGTHALAASWRTAVGDVEVGFVGAVTPDLPTLVDPAGIADVTVTAVAAEVNAEAAALETAGVDVVVLLLHDDATPALTSALGGAVDAVVAGHTGRAYTRSDTVPSWVSEGRAVTARPVVSPGALGSDLGSLTFTVDLASGAVAAMATDLLPLDEGDYAADPATQEIVDAAVADAEVLGAAPLATLSEPLTRAEGRESQLANLVAEAQRAATGADLALVDPASLAADLPAGATTKRQAADVQPTASPLVSASLTGRQLRTALEQRVLGTSDGVSWTFDPTLPAGSRITGLWLDGAAVVPNATYDVTVSSALAPVVGGTARDTGRTDLAAFLKQLGGLGTVTPDPLQHAVGVSHPGGKPASYVAGGELAVDVSSLLRDTAVSVALDDVALGDTDVVDGTAAVRAAIPLATAAGSHTVTITGATTGTVVTIAVTVVRPALADSATIVSAPASVAIVRGRPTVSVVVAAPGATPTGDAEVWVDGVRARTVQLVDGRASATLAPFTVAGAHRVQVRYLGDATTAPSTSPVARIAVAKATPRMQVSVRRARLVTIDLAAAGFRPTGQVVVRVRGDVYAAVVRNGRAVVRLASYRPGPSRAVVTYSGDARTATARAVSTFRVPRG